MLAWMSIEMGASPQALGSGIAAGAHRRARGESPRRRAMCQSGPHSSSAPPRVSAVTSAVQLKYRLHYDDALDVVVGVHMVGGALGVVLTGVFASLAVNAAGVAAGDGCSSDASVSWPAPDFLYPFIMTIAILWVTEKTVGLRVSATDQAIGLDASDIGERAYVVETSEEAVI